MDNILENIANILEQRKDAATGSSYVASLYANGIDAILKKVGEEATEVVIAAKNGDKDKLVHEVADLWFHTLVLLAQQQLSPNEVLQELNRRVGISGLDEKAQRSTPP